MTVDKIVADKQFGHLYIKTNSRARRYTFRPANDGTPEVGLLITVPVYYRLDDVLRSVEEMRPQLAKMLEQSPTAAQGEGRPHIDWDFKVLADCLHITLVKEKCTSFALRHERAKLHKDERGWVVMDSPARIQLVCPQDCDFDVEGRQPWLEKVLVEALRDHAKIQLIPRMKELARRHGIALNEVKINNSKGHWGSCARHKRGGVTYFNINLSLYTLLLPLPVQRLILLHELCHTRHMDHSEAFHRDLNVWLGGQEQALEEQLKRFATSVFSFVERQA